MANPRVIIQGKLFQKCTHLLYCSALFLCGNVNTRRMSQSDMGSIFYIKKINDIFWPKETIMWINKIFIFQCFYPPRILLHLFLFTNSAQRELGFNMYAEYAQLAINFPCIISMAIHDSQRHPCAQYWHCCALIRNIYCAKSWHYEYEFCVQRHLHLHYPIGFRIGKTNIGK